MTFSQCQDILHVGKNTLLDLLHDGKLDGFKIGSRWRITREDLEEFVEHARWDS
ncbi:MAG: helix-turn-helix domain-containing protein [Roseburia sp.]|nr:helix-turn-helix domain-containing protein [Roseburia sp.]